MDQAKQIAERIARRVNDLPTGPSPVPAHGELASELAAMRASLGELQKRLVQIEAKVSSAPSSEPNTAPRTHSPWLAGVNESNLHPSQDRFGVEEATVSELVDFFQNEKTCGVEPGGKPCDHCAMCSSRGF
jgi:hypothetical protein